MLEHATYLECVPIRLCHDAVQTVSTTLAATNTAKVVDLLEVTYGVDLPTRDNEDHKDDNKEEEVEFVTYEKEEHLPRQELPLTWLPNQLILLSSPSLLTVPLLLLPSDHLPRSRAKVSDTKMWARS